YFAARNSVELYPDSLPALQRITARWPLVSLTNGNADLQRIGIHAHFADQLGVAPAEVLHVGDDPAMDICGARDAGLRTAWINREGRPWPTGMGPPPELDLPDMAALADWLDAGFSGG